jgi:hypothetical protein
MFESGGPVVAKVVLLCAYGIKNRTVILVF